MRWSERALRPAPRGRERVALDLFELADVIVIGSATESAAIFDFCLRRELIDSETHEA